MTAVSDGDSLVGLWFDGSGHTVRADGYSSRPTDVLTETFEWLDTYFSGEEPTTTPKTSLSGTPFRNDVWNILRTVDYGTTVTYGDIAKKLINEGTRNMSAQAVGGAVGHNPVAVIIPCHRVIGSGGKLTGYAGGIDRKLKLLRLEGVDVSRFRRDRTRRQPSGPQTMPSIEGPSSSSA